MASRPGHFFRAKTNATAPHLTGVCRENTLRALGEFCGSAVIDRSQEFHRRDAEHAELTLRKTIIPTDSLTEGPVSSPVVFYKHATDGVGATPDRVGATPDEVGY